MSYLYIWELINSYAVFKVHKDASAWKTILQRQARLPEHNCFFMHWHVMPWPKELCSWGSHLVFLTEDLSVIRNLNLFKSLITHKCSFLWIWRPPALPHRLQCSTIGRPGLNLRVRDGNGCVPRAHRHQILPSYLSNWTINNSPYFFRFSWIDSAAFATYFIHLP